MKKLDLYIIKKFLGTFVFTIVLLLAIAIVIDISEKIDDFMQEGLTLSIIIEDYYVNFLLFYGNMFMPLVVFLAAILFTSKMAEQTEIVAYLASGISFNRLLYPYFIGATVLAFVSLMINHQILPQSNSLRKEFESKYVDKKKSKRYENIHRQIKHGEYIYIKTYNTDRNQGFDFSVEKFEGTKLKYKLTSDYINFNPEDSVYKLRNWRMRILSETNDKISNGYQKDTTFAFLPKDLTPVEYAAETMPYFELNEFIKEQEFRGSENLSKYLVEKHRRTSMPASTYILTLIAVSLSYRKKRGGMGMNLATGLGLMVLYIFFMRIADTFAIKDDFPPLFAVWIPNITFGLLSLYLYNNARK
ncbi:MAG: LptF/LptG family permease [Flavobacteriales bacterium]|nr:LptF/LptG family permease [Flavobacteriales bacterium]